MTVYSESKLPWRVQDAGKLLIYFHAGISAQLVVLLFASAQGTWWISLYGLASTMSHFWPKARAACCPAEPSLAMLGILGFAARFSMHCMHYSMFIPYEKSVRSLANLHWPYLCAQHFPPPIFGATGARHHCWSLPIFSPTTRVSIHDKQTPVPLSQLFRSEPNGAVLDV